MKFFFLVQGEGMGHTTQSLALRSLLEKNGHTVVTTFLGSNFFRGRNELYRSVSHERFLSAIFLGSRDRKGINFFLTFLYNLILLPLYIITIFRIAYRIRISDAQSVIIFYDMVAQLGAFLSLSGKPVYSISHHFFFGHPSFRWPGNRITERKMLQFHSWLASLGAKKKLALSFTSEPGVPGKNLFVVPPLLRSEILNSEPFTGDHIHIYCLQPGFYDDIAGLALRNPGREFRIFLHAIRKDITIPKNIRVFPVSGDLFLESISSCAMLFTTAGFETPAEALYLNKPLVVVPSGGHFEQYCNAIDALRTGLATTVKNFNEIDMVSIQGKPAHREYMNWIAEGEKIFLSILTE